MLTYLNLLTYLLLTLVWAGILWFSISRLKYRKTTSAFFVTVLLILMLDAGRTIIESIYFGIRNLSMAGFISPTIFKTMNLPQFMVMPKAVNLAVAVLIGAMLYRKWLPMQEADQRKTEEHIRELEERTIEQEVTEKALRESEERFRNIVNASPMGMHLYELKGNGDLILTNANPAADTILGINHSTLVGEKIEDAFPALRFSHIPDRYRAICEKGENWHSEELRYEEGDITGAFEIHAFQTSSNQMATQFIDITQRKLAEEALSMTQFTLDNAAISIFWITMEGDISYVNQAGCELLGYTHDEVLQMGIASLTPDISIRADILKTIKAEGSTTFEGLALHKDGTHIPLEVTSHYIKFGEKEFEFLFVLDITKKKESEEVLETMNKNLEGLVEERTHDLEQTAAKLKEVNLRLTEVDRMKSAMLSTVTHELKTPLTSIIGYTKLTDRDFARDYLPLAAGNASLTHRGNRIKENLSIIGQEGTRLLGLVDNFLALSRIRGGTASGELKNVDLKAQLERAVYLSQSYFSTQPDISLEVSIEDNLPAVHADPNGILQVAINLLDNAAKFGGHGTVYLSATAHGDSVLISVSDSGPGIPEAERHKIFEPFYQICEDEDCTIKPEGTGTGLAICKQVVENCGGTIWFDSPDSGGTEFIVELPVVKDAPKQ